MKQFKTVLNYINFISFLSIAAASIYTFSVIIRVSLYLFFISYLLELIVEKKWKSVQFEKKTFYFIIIIGFFLIAPISGLFDDTPVYVNYLVERRLPLFGFAIVGIFGLNKLYNIKLLFQTMIISSFIAIIYLVFYRIGIKEFITNTLRADIFQEFRIKYVHGHMMFNFYLNLSIIGIWYILTTEWKKTSWFIISSYFIVFILFMYFLLISEGRTGFTEACLLILISAFIELWKWKRKAAIVLLVLIPFILFGAISHHRRISKDAVEKEARLFLYKTAFYLIEEKPVFGYGLSNAQEKFDIERAKYQSESFRVWSLKINNIDSHNQYLHTTLEFGIVGLILLLFIYYFPILVVNRNRLTLLILFIGLYSYHSIFDMFITGQFATVFSILMLSILNNESEDYLRPKSAGISPQTSVSHLKT
ncbi:MAG: O-antigen ligase family protein [Paludibacter sp.]